MIAAPTDGDVRRAFEQGAQVRAGFPTVVTSADGIHVLNLVAAMDRRADKWVSTRTTHDGAVVEVVHGCQATIGVHGVVSPADTARVRAALAAAPKERHGAETNLARLEAGRLAMAIRDAHVRAHVLTLVDGWEAVIDGAVIERTEDGVLGKPSLEGVEANILVVTCPSTGRRYAHLVPQNLRTARDARRWIMGLRPGDPAPDVET